MALYQLGDEKPDIVDPQRCWVAPDASVIGKVLLTLDTSIWFGSILRGDNELIRIGERSNVQDGCVLHTDKGFPLTVGEDCTIGHKAILHGCTIGSNTLIGMGATVLNGAVIGRNCIIGANALVLEDKEIPDNSLVVGAPGRIARRLNDDAIADITASAASYVRNWQRYKADLLAL